MPGSQWWQHLNGGSRAHLVGKGPQAACTVLARRHAGLERSGIAQQIRSARIEAGARSVGCIVRISAGIRTVKAHKTHFFAASRCSIGLRKNGLLERSATIVKICKEGCKLQSGLRKVLSRLRDRDSGRWRRAQASAAERECELRTFRYTNSSERLTLASRTSTGIIARCRPSGVNRALRPA